MKKILVWLLVFSLIFSFGCAKKDDSTELIVFAAASMTETLTELAERYEAEHPNIKITFNFDSSGTLQTQIEAGAECDVFISAGQKQANALEDAGLLMANSRFDILENKVVLTVPNGNPADVQSFDDLPERLQAGDILLAMGNSDVPVGQYTQKIFAFYGIDEAKIAGNITYGTNVKEVTTQVTEAAADCGIVYATDAASADLTVVDAATADMCGQVIYPAAIVKNTAHEQAARDFLGYLTSDEASSVFAAVGFTPLS